MPEQTAAMNWTCGRCDVTASWAAGTDRPDLPLNWIAAGDEVFCLGCRRELAAEEGIAGLDDDVSLDDRRKLRSHARIEFEISREPDRADNRIAKVCHTSIVSVRKARERMGMRKRPPRRDDAD
jgi:hypothetical protein